MTASQMGKLGGAAKTPKKVAAAKRNIKKALAFRRKKMAGLRREGRWL
jgi:hypothetical protein